MEKIRSCGFLIYRNSPQRSFLLMRHANRWDLPKGHVDPGETKLQCAYRELEEETNITADDIHRDESFKFKHKYKVKLSKDGTELKKKTLTIYLAELIRPVDIRPTEHPAYAWFDWNPPHKIQNQTIDPLLKKLAKHWLEQATKGEVEMVKNENCGNRSQV